MVKNNFKTIVAFSTYGVKIPKICGGALEVFGDERTDRGEPRKCCQSDSLDFRHKTKKNGSLTIFVLLKAFKYWCHAITLQFPVLKILAKQT
jgi:hypothetical protein